MDWSPQEYRLLLALGRSGGQLPLLVWSHEDTEVQEAEDGMYSGTEKASRVLLTNSLLVRMKGPPCLALQPRSISVRLLR